MINQTKQILEESLKKLMLQKPLDKDNHPRFNRELRHQPYGFLLSL